MKALTIQQPWATLIALGEKRFETRSRRTNIRGTIAIHAGKTIDREACEREPIKSTLAKYGYTADNLPRGSVLAVAELVNSHTITFHNPFAFKAECGDLVISGNEYSFGWYREDRHAWELADVKQLQEPIPAKGQQGLWSWRGTT